MTTTTAPDSKPAPSSTETTPRKSTPSQAPDKTPAATATLQPYEGANFSMMVPSGWVQDVNEAQTGKEAEPKWSNSSNSSEYIRLDVHTPTHLTTQEDAAPVRRDLEKSSEYNEISYGPGDLSHAGSWMWIFEDERSKRVDYFFETCANTVAVLGSTPPARFNEMRATFREVADSFRSNCE